MRRLSILEIEALLAARSRADALEDLRATRAVNAGMAGDKDYVSTLIKQLRGSPSPSPCP